MGWLFSNITRKTLVDSIVQSYRNHSGKYELVDHSVNGNYLYMVIKTMADDCTPTADGFGRVILVYKLQGSGDGDWGYKDMSEYMGPYETGCPERLLKQSTCQTETAVAWRENCRESRRNKRSAILTLKTLKPGDVIKNDRGNDSDVLVFQYVYNKTGTQFVASQKKTGKTFRYPVSYLTGSEIVKTS